MDVNKITLNQPPGTSSGDVPRRGGGNFQLAYAKVLGERSMPGAAPPHPDRNTHTVRAGETLYGIVRSHLQTMGIEANASASMQGVKQLAQTNNIRNADRIYVGQKIDFAALQPLGRIHTASVASAIDRSTIAASAVDQPRPQFWDDPMPEPEADMQLPAEEAADEPLMAAAQPPSIPQDEGTTDSDANISTSLQARQVALYADNAPVATEKPREWAGGLPDIVYKGVVGKVLDAIPLEPTTRTALQKANTIVSSTVAARSLGALAGLGGPLLTVAGLIWGIFSSRQIDASAAVDTKSSGQTKSAGAAKPAGDSMRTAQNKPPEALN